MDESIKRADSAQQSSDLSLFRLAAIALVIVSGLANVRFGWGLGSNQFDSAIWSLASLASDTLKAFAVGFLVAALVVREWSRVLALVALIVVTAAYSMASAVGFAASTRDQTVGAVSSYIDTKKRAERAYTLAETEFEKRRKGLSVADVNREIATARAGISVRRWRSSKKCTNATVKGSVSQCKPYLDAVSKLDRAKERERWERKLEVTRRTLDALPKVNTMTADPQATMLVSMLGAVGLKVDEETIRSGLTVLLIALVELGSLLGLYVSEGVQCSRQKRQRSMIAKGVLNKQTEHSNSQRSNARLNTQEIRVRATKDKALGMLAARVQRDGNIFTTVRILSQELNASVGTVQAVINELGTMGVVNVHRSRRGTQLEWNGTAGRAAH